MPFVGSCCDPGTTLVSPAVVAAFGGWPGDPVRILEDQSTNRGSKHGKCHGGPRGFGETYGILWIMGRLVRTNITFTN